MYHRSTGAEPGEWEAEAEERVEWEAWEAEAEWLVELEADSEAPGRAWHGCAWPATAGWKCAASPLDERC